MRSVPIETKNSANPAGKKILQESIHSKDEEFIYCKNRNVSFPINGPSIVVGGGHGGGHLESVEKEVRTGPLDYRNICLAIELGRSLLA